MLNLKRMIPIASLCVLPFFLVACDDGEPVELKLKGEYGQSATVNLDYLRDKQNMTDAEIEKYSQEIINAMDRATLKNEVAAKDKSTELSYSKILDEYLQLKYLKDADMMSAMYELKQNEMSDDYVIGFIYQVSSHLESGSLGKDFDDFYSDYKKAVENDKKLNTNKFLKEFVKAAKSITTFKTKEEGYKVLRNLERYSNTLNEFSFYNYLSEGFYYSDFIAMKSEERSIARNAGGLGYFLDEDRLAKEFNQLSKTSRKNLVTSTEKLIKKERSFAYETKSFRESNLKRMNDLDAMLAIIKDNDYKYPKNSDTAKKRIDGLQKDLLETSEKIGERISELDNTLVNPTEENSKTE